MRSLLASFFLCAVAVTAFGQGASIHATSRLFDDGSKSNTVIDSEKRTAEETVEDARGKVTKKTTYLLDDRNLYLGSITYDPKGAILYRSAFKYDGAGRLEEESISTGDGQFLRRRVYAYDAKNKVSNVTEYDANGNAMVSSRRASGGKAAATPFPTKSRK